LQELTNWPLKFEEGREQNKNRLISVIYSRNPNYKIFEKSGSQIRRTLLLQEFNFLNRLKINFKVIDKIMKLLSQQIKDTTTFRLSEKEREFSKLKRVRNLKKGETVSLEEGKKSSEKKKEFKS